MVRGHGVQRIQYLYMERMLRAHNLCEKECVGVEFVIEERLELIYICTFPSYY